MVGTRVVKGSATGKAKQAGEDVEMGDEAAEEGVGEKKDEEGEEDESDEEEADEKIVPTTVTRMSVSPDGQWLATSDDRCRTHVFNLDSIQVRLFPLSIVK